MRAGRNCGEQTEKRDNSPITQMTQMKNTENSICAICGYFKKQG